MLKSKGHEAITGAESNSASLDTVDRLDLCLPAESLRETSAQTPNILIMTINAGCDEYDKDPGLSRIE